MNLDIISEFETCNILVVGDLMIDEYLWGETDRISPEAPVQVVSIKNEDYALGGAGNVVNNIVSLGAKVSAAGVIGVGRNGQFLRQKFDELGVDTGGIVQESNRPTTQKTRIIASNQHVLRIDRETNKAISKSTLEKITQFIEAKIPGIDVVLISDYGKGLITKPLLSRLMAAAQKHKKITVVDPKGLEFTKYSGASLLTPNKKEAALASGIEIVNESTLVQAGNKILETVRLDRLLNVYSYADAGIVMIAYCATVIGGTPEITPESREIRVFTLDEIPWDDLAFPSTREALKEYVEQENIRGTNS